MINTEARPERVLELLAWLCFLLAAYVAIRYAAQAPLDLHAFRQTQTALTSYWFLQDGFRLDYETPVGGYPWSIPFEFPIYQALVALIVKVSGCRLEVAARLLSFVFLTACLFPARQIVRKLQLPRTVLFAFATLLFSSPVYLYWGRTFMIETAALFFAVAAIPFWLDILRKPSLRSAVWFAVFSTLAILQKVTTEIPLLGVLALVWIWHVARSTQSIVSVLRRENLATGIVCFVAPVVIGAAWVFYSDAVKAENPLGAQLTSQALTAWNWGHLSQRFSSDLLVGALWRRLFEGNIAGPLGLFALCVGILPVLRPAPTSSRVVLFCTAVGLLPLFMFSNLYIVHKYYLVANTVFLLFGVAVVAGIAISQRGAFAGLAGITLIVVSNLFVFLQDYLPAAAIDFNANNSRDIAVGDVLQEETAPSQSFVAFGNDWSSSLAYFAKRKSFTVAAFFNRLAEAVEHPEHFIGNAPLGAVVACVPAADTVMPAVMEWAATRDWTVGDVYGCYVVVAPHFIDPAASIHSIANCDGGIDTAGILSERGSGKPVGNMLNINGWIGTSAETRDGLDAVYVALTDSTGKVSTRRAISVPRADIAVRLRRSKTAISGFSLITDASRLNGNYHVSVIRQVGGAFERCQWETQITLPVPATSHP